MEGQEAAVVRTCPSGQEFTLERKRGRPADHCPGCIAIRRAARDERRRRHGMTLDEVGKVTGLWPEALRWVARVFLVRVPGSAPARYTAESVDKAKRFVVNPVVHGVKAAKALPPVEA